MRLIIILLALTLCSTAYADVVGEVTAVKHDPERGSIIVETTYKIDGVVAQVGQTRYDETSGSVAEITTLVNEDIKEHCESLIKRIDANEQLIFDTMLNTNKELTQPILDELKPLILGHKETVTKAIQEFKGVQIEVTTDKPAVITDAIAEPVVP